MVSALAGAMVVTTGRLRKQQQENTCCTGRNNHGDDNEGRGTGGHDGSGLEMNNS